MISYISGQVLTVAHDSVVVDVHGVGYKIFATPEELLRFSVGSEAALHTHLAVRETALDLYGFTSAGDLSVFELLLTVSGIGPKSALSILSLASPETLKSAVSQGDAGYLTKVSGIGKKTAEKIVLELKDKAPLLGDSEVVQVDGEEEALEALRAMGYTLNEARDALKRVPKDVTGSSARVREALRSLSQ